MEKETTPIERFIEGSAKEHTRDIGYQATFVSGCNRTLAYLGLSDIPDPKKWVEDVKGYKEITGFETPAELAAYEKGREDEEKTIIKFIQDWKGETNSGLGQLLADKVQAENEKLKKALGRIYTMDTTFEDYINAMVKLKKIAGDAIK
jgi:hypothetical protein